MPKRDPNELRNTPVERKIEGTASRGKEEKLGPVKSDSRNHSNQPQLSRRQRRAQERKMRRG